NSPLGMNQMGNTVTQQPVPGPLPLLGAATMFGFSRKLRRRIQGGALENERTKEAAQSILANPNDRGVLRDPCI
ncbi:MAG: hypothetical protein VKO44_06190, partial [Cyanobacteriota bacterium]|nr:hypothetical protein [Cyanobacteriota bacterium]